MFSGITETLGKIIDIRHEEGCKHFRIEPKILFDDVLIGDSIAVNGTCLTVTEIDKNSFTVTAVPETLRLTNLQYLTNQQDVNLERALKANARIGGHYVQGHVDGMATIIQVTPDNSAALLVKFELDNKFMNYLVPKGYICIDGMSITLIEVGKNWFTVTFIPHTQKNSVAHQYQVGSCVNIEVDMMGKYAEKILGAYAHASRN